MKVQEFIQKIESGEAQVLTVEAAKLLKGKRIAWMYFGYQGNQNVVEDMVVGEILSLWDYYKTQPFEGFASRTAQWDTWMSEEKKEARKQELVLLDADGKDRYIRCSAPKDSFYPVPTFTCSDADREVYYVEL